MGDVKWSRNQFSGGPVRLIDATEWEIGLMKRVFRSLICVGALTAMASTTTKAQQAPRYAHTGPVLVTGARLIDGLGNGPFENQDILIAEGKIARFEDDG